MCHKAYGGLFPASGTPWSDQSGDRLMAAIRGKDFRAWCWAPGTTGGKVSVSRCQKTGPDCPNSTFCSLGSNGMMIVRKKRIGCLWSSVFKGIIEGGKALLLGQQIVQRLERAASSAYAALRLSCGFPDCPGLFMALLL